MAALFRRMDMPGMGSLSRDSVVGSTMGITRLVSDLCEIHLAGLPRTGALRDVWKRRLKQKAYGILLSRIFQDMRTSKTASVGSGVSTTPGKNKVLMLSFNLRVCGREEDAQRLEELLAMLDGPGMLHETGAVLDLLVDLAGTVPPPPQLFSRDFFRRTRKVIRQQELTGYEHPELRQLEARARAMVCGEEWAAIDSVHRTMTVMDAPPGTGLSTLRMQGRGPFEGEERYERETRLSLFGALVHSRTSDLDIRLDLPPVPSNAELTGLAIRVPPSVDQSEDEGFQSASNLTPDSQSEPSLTPDLDIWEAVLNYEPSQRRCWERIGCPPGKKEDPYVTEAGRAAFDQLYQVREAEIRLLSGSLSLSLAQPGPQSEADLVKDALNVLIGVASATFSLNQTATGFQVKHGIFISGTSSESVTSLLGELEECGTHYLRLSRFSLQPVFSSSAQKGLIFQAFTAGVRRYLHYYRACVLSTPHTLSLLNIAFLFKKLGRQLRYLSELCWCGGTAGALGLSRVGTGSFPTGVKLLSYLYQEAQNNCSNENYPVLLSLLRSSCEPYTRFIYDWVYSGVFRDVSGEFMIQVDEDYLGCRDRHFWTHGYVLISRDVEECVPVFLQHIANDIYMCGKTVNLLKVCSPMHYICSSELSVPRIAVTFSLQELEEIERDCEIYRGRMERIAQHSAISREAKALRTEIARQELIIQVQETATKTLETIQGRQLSQKLAQEAKKRELFLELKQQMEQEQQRRLAAQQQEEENDFGFARELRDREKRLQVLEQQLENKARMELIEHYSRLTEEAAAREQRALWKVRRHRLEAARVSFLENDAKEIQAQLEKFLLDKFVKQEDLQDATEQGRKDTTCLILDPPHQYSAPFLPKINVALSHTPSSEDRRSSVDTVDMQDFLPKFSNINSKVDAALADIGSELCEGDVIPQVNCDLHILCTQVSPTAKLSETTIKQDTGDIVQCETAMQSTALPMDSVNLKAHDDNIKVGENVSDVCISLPCSKAHGHSSDANIKIGVNMSDVPQVRPRWNIHGHASDANIKVGENVADVAISQPRWNIHGHISDASIKVGDNVSDVGVSQPHCSVHGHASDANIKVGENVSDVAQARPRWNVHGHASDSNIKVGENVSDVVQARPRWNIHGHASDANIKVGENMSDVAQARPRWNVHGHASDSSIKVGENVSDVVQARPRWNIHGHASDANIKVGENVSDVPQSTPRWNVHGHASDANIKVGENVSDVPVPHPRLNVHGHPSDAKIKLGENTSDISQDKPYNDTKSKLEERIEEPDQPHQSIQEHTSTSSMNTGLQAESEEGQELSRISQKQKEEATEILRKLGQEEKITLGKSAGSGPQWQSEQVYMDTMAARYEVDRYRDSYYMMDQLPDSTLLQQVTAARYALPLDPSLRRATDATAVQLSELVSLPVLMKHSVTSPLVTHVSLVNKAVVDYYFVELSVESHCEALRHFLLMEDGEFAQSLSDQLFEKLGTGQTPGQLLTPLVLNSILNKALQYSLHGHSQVASKLTFALRFMPDAFHPHAPDVLACLELQYKVDWPLNVVITESCMNKYNRIFSFLLQLKHMVWTLHDVWLHLRRAALVKGAGGSAQFRQLQLYRHEMQHFVKVIQGYIASQILQVSWSEFHQRLTSVGNLEDLYRAHADYLNKAVFRGLLTEKATPVMNIIHSIFSLILKFRAQLISQAWRCQQGVAEHPNFGAMHQSYRTFKHYSHFLFKVVTKLVNRGYQPHLEDFLLRINFNSYYRDS
ncbi:gamma-tubulin complex component 6 isoform X2 [Erpetoichthys calabaricus]|uniref:gamma-tubulin complex component 6 isoform X2 n=1 Tax=Erpetoichthys calabaricus TaxID=27687 RepID=UPI002234E014|nr:gamma-tubulin complex component 6 isoform X2 [Erpetoichthys calabaricus]